MEQDGLLLFGGGIHGVAICINHLWRKLNISLPRFITWLLTFNVVNLAWIFFRADSFDQAFNIIKAMTDVSSFCYPYSKWLNYFLIFLLAIIFYLHLTMCCG